jgi:hypothetical protein
LEQIQFLLGHVSVQTTERYLGCKQRFHNAVNDRIGLEPDPQGSPWIPHHWPTFRSLTTVDEHFGDFARNENRRDARNDLRTKACLAFLPRSPSGHKPFVL